MKEAKALAMIKQLQSELSIDNVKSQFWMDKVQGYVQSIFGDSTQSIALPMFGTYYWDRPFGGWDEGKTKKVVADLKKLFDTYESMIYSGAYLKPNFLSQYSTPEIIVTIILTTIGLIVTIGGGAFTLGQYIGEGHTDYKIYYLEKENDKIRDSMAYARQNARLLEDSIGAIYENYNNSNDTNKSIVR